MDLQLHVAGRFRPHPQVTAAFGDQGLQRSEIDTRTVAAEAGNHRWSRGHRLSGMWPDDSPLFVDDEEHVLAGAYMRVLRHEFTIDHHRIELDLQPAAERHPFAAVGGD